MPHHQRVGGDTAQRLEHRIQAVDRRRARVIGKRSHRGQQQHAVCRREKQRRQPRIASAGKALLVQPLVASLHVQIVNARERADGRCRAEVKPLFPSADEHVDGCDAGQTAQRIGHGLTHGEERLRFERAVFRRQIHRRNARRYGQRGRSALAAHRPRSIRPFQLRPGQQRRQRRLRQTLARPHRHLGRNRNQPFAVRGEQIERHRLRLIRKRVRRRRVRSRLDRQRGNILHRPFAHRALTAAEQRQRQHEQQRKAALFVFHRLSFVSRESSAIPASSAPCTSCRSAGRARRIRARSARRRPRRCEWPRPARPSRAGRRG